MGSNLGPVQAARHLAGMVTAHMLSFTNQRHVTVEKLDAARAELIELYLMLDLPKTWGNGQTVAADGTQFDFYDNNLTVGYHFRYRKLGAVAYRHVADNYIAVFCHFIPPGIWEAVYVIEGLMKQPLPMRATNVCGDTQAQAATVFAFTHLSGIHLLPRIRNWKDLKLSRPGGKRYRHIDGLFGEKTDWKLIRTHWKDLMQVALSIQAGKLSSAALLRRLGSENRQSKLYLAAHALGRVVRTLFLLDWISNAPLRQAVTATTNKVECYLDVDQNFQQGAAGHAHGKLCLQPERRLGDLLGWTLAQYWQAVLANRHIRIVRETPIHGFGFLAQLPLKLADKFLGGGRKSDARAVFRQPLLTFLPAQQLLAIVAVGIGSGHAQIPGFELFGDLRQHTHFKMPPVPLPRVFGVLDQLEPARRGKWQAQLAPSNPIGAAVLMLAHQRQRIEQCAVFRSRFQLERSQCFKQDRTMMFVMIP
jgi:TnpA family transposase